MFLKYYNITPYWKEQGNWNTAVSLSLWKAFSFGFSTGENYLLPEIPCRQGMCTYTHTHVHMVTGQICCGIFLHASQIMNILAKTTDEI